MSTSCILVTASTRTFLVILSALALLSWSPNAGVGALKHNYRTKNDERSLIGPIGFPFGFTDTGFLNLTVYDFELSIGDHLVENNADNDYMDYVYDFNTRSLMFGKKKKTPPKIEDATQVVDNIVAVGFIIKRFKDESDFNRYLNWLAANETRCAFQPFLDEYEIAGDDYLFMMGEDPDSTDDYFFNDGEGEVLDDVGSTGIFLNMMPKSRWGPNTAYVEHEFSKGQAGLYFLIYQICPKPNVDVHTTFEVDFHFSNLDVFGNESYLSAGLMALPHMFFYFALLYAICLYLWVSNIRLIGEGHPGHWGDSSAAEVAIPAGQAVVYPIHHMMTALLTLKFLTILIRSIRYHFLRVTGRTVFWSGIYYTFAFLKGTFLFTVILLIGSGWSFVKPFLSDREKKMACAVLGLQVINNIAITVLTQETEGEHAFDRWTAILHMVDILCCCAVLIPIVWHVNALEQNMDQSDAHNDPEIVDLQEDLRIPEDEFEELPPISDKRLASKLKLFRNFYLLVVGYIYLTRIVVYIFATMLDYRHTWLKEFVIETVSLAFYIAVGSLFRPVPENPYLSVPKAQVKTQVVTKEVELPRKTKKMKD